MAATLKTAAIISTGDEILGGRTVDTNSSYIADRLALCGLQTVSIISVGDYLERIQWAWEKSLQNADLVISTGGLGPTLDDLTSEALARVAGVELLRDETQARRIHELFAARGREMPANNLKQADLPRGAVVVPNPSGTAPGYRIEIPMGERRPVAVALPGVPREMKPMLDDSVIPWVSEHCEAGVEVLSETFQTFGLPESALDEMLDGAVDPGEGRLSFRASFPKIAVRVSVSGDPHQASQRLERMIEEISARLGSAVYARGETGMEQVVGELLRSEGKTLATAESCSGGLLGSRITDVAGSSDYYLGGIVAYSNDLKQRLLGVSQSTLERFGAVSEQSAREMALGVCRTSGADIGVAITGIAGPGGGSEDKPVGTVAIALAETGGAGGLSTAAVSDSARGAAGETDEGDDGVRITDDGDGDEATAGGRVMTMAAAVVESRMYRLWGKRDWVKQLAAQLALDWIRRRLLGLDVLDSDFGLDGRKRS